MVRESTHIVRMVLVMAVHVALVACGSDEDVPAPVGAGGAGGTGTSCPNGHVADVNGVCMPVGIQGCAELFIPEDGLCHPATDKCPAGTIPKFDEGCVPVGIRGCVELFVEEDGLCHPAMDKCPAGTIPKLDEGCVPVGIQGCAEQFIEEDGLCHPSADKCPAGTIPDFDAGCVPVGISGCAAVFMEDGLCQPSMSKCPPDTFAVPLDGCLPIDGSPGCGSGIWGEIPDGANTIWVDPSYGGGGSDGSQSKPVLTIGAAFALVPAGGRVALAAGTYAEPVKLTQSVELVGRCPSMVTINGMQPTPYGLAAAVWVDQATG